ncbi:MAG TPA: transposase [Bryobacteraceae bacterium]|jgi:REP element-mobilizing transposase RayT|nr:transposase [Bryobacteraceae bacterium]
MRRLPHVYPEGAWLFVTWHLHGSLPQARYPPAEKLSAGKAFVWMDRYLDTARLGPMFLKRPDVAEIIVEALGRGVAKGLFDLRAYVVMANHVHVLIRPLRQASRALQWLKGTTAREANLILARTGQPFWQHESYDHCARDAQELERIVAYIENNPVKAGLVAEASQYRWSSAWGGDGELKFAAAR